MAGGAVTGADRFSRDADGTFMGEWGYVYNYGSSGWSVDILFWTAEAWSTVYQFNGLPNGGVSYGNPSGGYAAVCRGE